MKPCKSPDYFIKVSFHIVVDMRQGEPNIFQISTWKAFLFLKIYLLWKIRPISVKRWKTVCGSVPAQFPGPIVHFVNLQQLAIFRLNVGTSDCESRTFFIKKFIRYAVSFLRVQVGEHVCHAVTQTRWLTPFLRGKRPSTRIQGKFTHTSAHKRCILRSLLWAVSSNYV